jgi:hypothetical protein
LVRLLVLLVTMLFVVAFAFLTITVIADHGLTFAGVISIFVVLLMGVGVVGSLVDYLRRR